MPFKSEAQRKFMYKNHPKIAERWSKEEGKSSGGKLPERIHPKKKSKFANEKPLKRMQKIFKRN
jgi:hypothetical protein